MEQRHKRYIIELEPRLEDEIRQHAKHDNITIGTWLTRAIAYYKYLANEELAGKQIYLDGVEDQEVEYRVSDQRMVKIIDQVPFRRRLRFIK